MSQPGASYRVGIAGAGSVAFGTAARLSELGHSPMLWSPSGTRTEILENGAALTATGAVEHNFHPRIASDAQTLCAENQVILIAVPGYGHKSVMDAIAPYLRSDQTVIISSHASLGALYLSNLMSTRGVNLPIVAWGTTMTTGRQKDYTTVQVNTVRSLVDICVVPDSATDTGLELCQALFGDRFALRDGLLAITLSNLNPQNHMGIALGNMSRMERGESWSQGQNLTPNIGRLLEALDRERLDIAEALGLSVRTIFEHFHLSFHVPVASISEMNAEMHNQGNGGTGPATADSRYVTEDVPYGLVMTVRLGELAGRPAKLHRAGIEIFSAMYGRDFFAENELLDAIEMSEMTVDELSGVVRSGTASAKRKLNEVAK